MFIQEIIIDGFKSYAKRTVIEGYVHTSRLCIYDSWHEMLQQLQFMVIVIMSVSHIFPLSHSFIISLWCIITLCGC
jgi:hypothetical protein